MKTKLLILSFLFISFGLISCDNDEERFFLYEMGDIYFPDKPISSIVLEITNGGAVGMTGGVAPYTVKTGDEGIAKAKIQEEYGYVMLSPVQLGTTDLVVTDANGLTAKIEVKVVKGLKSFRTETVIVEIEGLDDDEEKVALENQVIADSDMRATGGIKFVYDTNEGGTLTISKEDASGVTITAPFTREIRQMDEKTFISFIHVKYNGKDHEFYFDSPKKMQPEDEVTRALGPLYCWLVEDVTQVYKEAYPKVTSVKRVYDGQISR